MNEAGSISISYHHPTSRSYPYIYVLQQQRSYYPYIRGAGAQVRLSLSPACELLITATLISESANFFVHKLRWTSAAVGQIAAVSGILLFTGEH